MSESGSFVAELQRRHVVRAAIAHVLVGWLLIQVADVVLPYLGIVDDPVAWAFAISVATFPMTIMIAWLIEQPWRERSGSRLVLEIAVIFVMTAVAWTWAYDNLPARVRTSIVILPFEHSGDAGEQAISRGMSYEIGRLLLRTKSIDVIGYQSAN